MHCMLKKRLYARSDIAKATTVETIATIQKGTIIHEEGRTARGPQVVTDGRG